VNRLAIDFDRVTEVLLPDGWHSIREGSLAFGDYEYARDPHTAENGGLDHSHDGTLGEFGFELQEIRDMLPEVMLAGPVTAILAVRYPTADDADDPTAL
jgi:hypothetical protein